MITGVAALATCALFGGEAVHAQGAPSYLRALTDARDIEVNLDNFVRAATDIEFGKYLALSGGVNRFFHVREPTPIDQQPTIRMNRDVIYSMALIDIGGGATLSMPEAGERYVSTHILNRDHFTNAVFVGGGEYELTLDEFDTQYVVAIIRTLVDASDPEDVAEVHALQDKMAVTAASSEPFIVPDYDEDSFQAVLKAAIELARYSPDSSDTFGSRDEVRPVRHFLGAAFGWGGLPEDEAFYLNVDPGLPVGEYRIEVPADVPVREYWSISLYNEDGFYERNALAAYNVNSIMGERNDDGSMTIHLGGCEDGRVNCLPIMEGWNYTVRLYRPEQEVLSGDWRFPDARRIE
jgi:hypothetical protein